MSERSTGLQSCPTSTGRVSLLVALALTIAACSSKGTAASTTSTMTTTAPTTTTTTTMATTTTATTTSTTTTTTTTVPPVGYSSVNGLPVYDRELLDRRVLMVKIDNSVPAQPQSGIQLADAMVELVVVQGTTRFIAMFHSSDAEYIGPIRSLRPSDLQIAAAVGGTMVNTGAQPWVSGMAIQRDIPRVTFYPSIMYRIPERELPHNVYGSTLDFRDFADDRGFPDVAPTPWLYFGDPPSAQSPAQDVTLTWGRGVHDVEWRYNAETTTYERVVLGEYQEWVDEEGERGRIDADVLVVISGRYYIATAPVNASGPRTPVPAIETVGSGRVWVFSKGGGWEGTWQRDSERELFRFLDASGKVAAVPPGRLWVSLLPTELVEFE